MQQGGSQYGVSPEMTSSYTGTHMLDALQQQQLMQQQKPGETAVLAEAASPISSRPPARGNFDELGSVPGSFPEEDALVGEEGERGVSGNRWPRQETLALLKIRSEMDAVFRDATLKGPLWEDVSRKLAELGYKRSAKKCKEKFENVHKYYKRTKEGRAGRQDGKSYRFFSQLEALHSSSNAPTTAPAAAAAAAAPIEVSNAMVVSSTTISQPTSVPAPAAISIPINVSRMGPDLAVEPATGMSGSAAGISFSSDTSSSSSESEEAMEEGPSTSTRKRKRSGSGGGGSKKMTTFFEGLMKQVMEKQEAMQQRFLEAIEKREQDRMIREEAWKRQEMARIAHEHDIMAQERAISASRDAAVIAFLQKITGQTIQLPQLVTISTAMPPPQPPPPPQTQPQPVPAPSPVPQQQQKKQQQQQPQPQPQQPQLQTQQQQQQPQSTEIVAHQPSCSDVIVAQQEHHEMVGSFDPVSSASSSRWPKSEVLALIKIRSGLESRYQEAGPKGPLWEEISAQMQQLGFNRSSKRCKEKWENINKYFKKVKESNKKRPEDAKTCPYFHQLDALYRKKIFSSSSGSSGAVIQRKQEQETNPNSNPNQNSQQRSDILAIMPPPPPPPSQPETDIKKSNNGNGGSTEAGNSSQVQTSTRSLTPSFQEEGPMKKPEDIVKELMEQQHQDEYDKLNGLNLEEQEEEDEEDDDGDYDDDYDDGEDEEKLAYKIQFQRQNPGPPTEGNPASAFLTMIQ